MSLIQFTENYEDLSTDQGFQFKFFCDRCRNGYMSSFQTSALGAAGSLLRAAGSMFGGVFGSAANSTYDIQRAVARVEHGRWRRRWLSSRGSLGLRADHG